MRRQNVHCERAALEEHPSSRRTVPIRQVRYTPDFQGLSHLVISSEISGRVCVSYPHGGPDFGHG